jgi:putative flippase GtrA|tara:strand:- start:660 stop:1046 length:387 start_codon:yes stop_codon:yes gene_type:complete
MIKNKLPKFLIIGFLNTIFGYFIGIFFYKMLYHKFGIILVGISSNFFAILFSFLNFKFFVFKTKMKYFFSEIAKSFFVYTSIFIISTLLLYLLIEIFYFNIYIAQGIIIFISIVISVFSQFLIVFKNK